MRNSPFAVPLLLIPATACCTAPEVTIHEPSPQASVSARKPQGPDRPADVRKVDPEVDLDAAERAFAKGADADALFHLLRSVDAGIDTSPAFAGVWLSGLPPLFLKLTRRFPPAQAALLERLSTTEARLKTGSVLSFGDLMMYIELSDAIGDVGRVLLALDAGHKGGLMDRPTELAFVQVALPIMLRLHRMDLVVAYAEEIVPADPRSPKCNPVGLPPGWQDPRNERFTNQGALVYSELLRAQDDVRARAIRERITGRCVRPKDFAVVHGCAQEAGRADETARLTADAKAALSADEFVEFTRLIAAPTAPCP